MKVNFTCNTCSENFFIEDKFISKKSKIICPNCGSEFPNEALINLQSAVESLTKAHKSIPMSEIEYDINNTWEFSLND